MESHWRARKKKAMIVPMLRSTGHSLAPTMLAPNTFIVPAIKYTLKAGEGVQSNPKKPGPVPARM